MLKLKKMTIKNFMSFGNIEHEINLDENLFTLILGENRDVTTNGSYMDSKNGCGKTSLIYGISYVLYDRVLGNVKKDNLVNKLNEKNMVVSIEFTKNSDSYKIIRGRKPNILKFYVNSVEYDESLAQGENRETQIQIEKAIGINFELFKQIVTLSAQGESFLSLRTKEQRDIIEELLGITQLSKKAETLKERIRETQKKIDQESFQLQTLQNLNDKTLSQIKRLQQMSDKWFSGHENSVSELEESIKNLEILDISTEINKHETMKKVSEFTAEYSGVSDKISGLEKVITKVTKSITLVDNKLDKAKHEKKCYACGQSIDENHGNLLDDLGKERTQFEHELLKHNEELASLQKELSDIEGKILAFGDIEVPFYKTEKEVWEHNNTIDALKNALDKELSQVNPYTEQIETLKKESLSEICTQSLDSMKDEKVHMEFLLKILTNKDSFVRKKIIDQSLPFLNFRLDHYLTEMGLPHSVTFQNDLSVSIDLLGREYDFDNLSRGQKTRLIISLNLAFIDVFESLNYPINMIFIDELIDNGLDGAGIDNSIKIFKDITRATKKSVFLVSHRDEIQPRVEKTLKVVMENGFSSIHDEND